MKMKIGRLAALAWLSIASACAGTVVDVSHQTAIQFNQQDTLSFLVSNLSLRASPDSVGFQFISQSLDPSSQFAAELMSPDESSQAAFADIQLASGVFVGARYDGPISSVFATLSLPGTLSDQIFRNGRAILVLKNLGPAMTISVPGYLLPQDLSISLHAGDTSVSAFTSDVWYGGAASAPENNSFVLTALALLLRPFAKALRHAKKARFKSPRSVQIQRLQSGQSF